MRLRNIKNKEEKFNSSNIITNPAIYKGKWHQEFNNDNPIYLEIGMGRGNYIINMAKENPNINYIGIEKFDSVILKAYEKSKDLNISNLKLIRIDALNINDIFDKEITKLFLTFSDPWPKKRHHKRRLTSKIFLDKYETIFKNNKNIFMKTDNLDLFTYSKETLKEHGYEIIREDNNFKDNILTEYETKFTNLKQPIYMLNALK